MPGLMSCPSCAELVPQGTCACPFCGSKAACASRVLPAAALLLGLVMAGPGCDFDKDVQSDYSGAVIADDSDVQADYSVAVTDGDGDGWSVEAGDCNDADENIHPDAAETVGDSVDSDCDGDPDA